MFSHEATEVAGAGVLLALGVFAAVWLVVLYRRTQYTPLQFPFYLLNCVLVRILWRAEIRGRIPIPDGQGAVIVCNHRSPIDPAFIGYACNRQVHWMVAEEFCRRGFFAACMRILQVIPTNRGGVDTRATKHALRYVERGELVGMFPEGRINTTHRFMLPGRPGAAMVALKGRVPVVPCYVEGSPYRGRTFDFFIVPARTRLIIGRPIDLTEYFDRDGDKDVLADITRRLMVEIARLAGKTDFVPDLAGRSWKSDPAPQPVPEWAELIE